MLLLQRGFDAGRRTLALRVGGWRAPSGLVLPRDVLGLVGRPEFDEGWIEGGQTKAFQNTARWIGTGGGRWMRAGNNDSRDGGGAVLGGGGMCSGVWCWRLAVEWWCGVGGAID